MHFQRGYFFDDEFERMKTGLNSNILLEHKSDILAFHDLLLKKIETTDNSISCNSKIGKAKRKNASSEMKYVTLSEKDRQIEELQEKITELEEKVDNRDREVLSQFISLLDSKKYDYLLGKLYRIAYTDDTIKFEDIQRILKNLFEIMNISGIDIYGELGTRVNCEEIKRGKYRVDNKIAKEAKIKYPGYRLGNSVILHPVAEEE